jgi:two-component system response regulator AtoC
MTKEPAVGLEVLLVDDDEIVHDTVGSHLEALGHRVAHEWDGRAGLDRIASAEFDLVLLDVRMPEMDGLELLPRARELRPTSCFVIITGHATMETAVEALRHGATDFLAKPVKLLELEAVLEKARHARRLLQDRHRLRQTLDVVEGDHLRRRGYGRLIGGSAAMATVRDQLEAAAEAGCDTVLITGESGVGKEVAAREFHLLARGEGAPFIAVSCPALADSLLESELFGHLKGSFTGADRERSGCFELADGGTLLLDEIGDLSARGQAALLRVLETRRFRKVGGSVEHVVDILVVAATNRPLEELVEAGGFRRDLLHRLERFTVEIPPLRERREDIPPLAEHFLSLLRGPSAEPSLELEPAALEALLGYDFPGNVRELRNLLERAAILARGAAISSKHLGLGAARTRRSRRRPTGDGEDVERQRILGALEATRWNRRRAAEELDMPYSTLRYKMLRLGIR